MDVLIRRFSVMIADQSIVMDRSTRSRMYAGTIPSAIAPATATATDASSLIPGLIFSSVSGSANMIAATMRR